MAKTRKPRRLDLSDFPNNPPACLDALVLMGS